MKVSVTRVTVTAASLILLLAEDSISMHRGDAAPTFVRPPPMLLSLGSKAMTGLSAMSMFKSLKSFNPAKLFASKPMVTNMANTGLLKVPTTQMAGGATAAAAAAKATSTGAGSTAAAAAASASAASMGAGNTAAATAAAAAAAKSSNAARASTVVDPLKTTLVPMHGTSAVAGSTANAHVTAAAVGGVTTAGTSVVTTKVSTAAAQPPVIPTAQTSTKADVVTPSVAQTGGNGNGNANPALVVSSPPLAGSSSLPPIQTATINTANSAPVITTASTRAGGSGGSGGSGGGSGGGAGDNRSSTAQPSMGHTDNVGGGGGGGGGGGPHNSFGRQSERDFGPNNNYHPNGGQYGMMPPQTDSMGKTLMAAAIVPSVITAGTAIYSARENTKVANQTNEAQIRSQNLTAEAQKEISLKTLASQTSINDKAMALQTKTADKQNAVYDAQLEMMKSQHNLTEASVRQKMDHDKQTSDLNLGTQRKVIAALTGSGGGATAGGISVGKLNTAAAPAQPAAPSPPSSSGAAAPAQSAAPQPPGIATAAPGVGAGAPMNPASAPIGVASTAGGVPMNTGALSTTTGLSGSLPGAPPVNPMAGNTFGGGGMASTFNVPFTSQTNMFTAGQPMAGSQPMAQNMLPGSMRTGFGPGQVGNVGGSSLAMPQMGMAF